MSIIIKQIQPDTPFGFACESAGDSLKTSPFKLSFAQNFQDSRESLHLMAKSLSEAQCPALEKAIKISS